jgi:hypothetical protein
VSRFDDEGRLDGTSLRGLTGRGPSQVGVSAAMRARDVSRPTPQHLTEAEALDLDIASRARRAQQRSEGGRRTRRRAPAAGDEGGS